MMHSRDDEAKVPSNGDEDDNEKISMITSISPPKSSMIHPLLETSSFHQSNDGIPLPIVSLLSPRTRKALDRIPNSVAAEIENETDRTTTTTTTTPKKNIYDVLPINLGSRFEFIDDEPSLSEIVTPNNVKVSSSSPSPSPSRRKRRTRSKKNTESFQTTTALRIINQPWPHCSQRHYQSSKSYPEKDTFVSRKEMDHGTNLALRIAHLRRVLSESTSPQKHRDDSNDDDDARRRVHHHLRRMIQIYATRHRDQILRHAFQHWVHLIETIRCCIRIQSNYRRHFSKLELLARRNMYEIRLRNKRRALEVIHHKQRTAAISIQRMFRSILFRKRLDVFRSNNKASKKLQCGWRCRVARRAFTELKCRKERDYEAAKTIQTRIRRWRSRRRLRILKNIEASDALMRCLRHGKYEIRRKLKRVGAALKIQRGWRRRRILKRERMVREWELRCKRNEAAAVIQREIRSYLLRLATRQNETEKSKKMFASVLIQSCLRRHSVQLKTEQLKSLNKEKNANTAPFHHRHFTRKFKGLRWTTVRGTKTHRFPIDIRKVTSKQAKFLRRINPMCEKEHPAVTCQRVFRGHRARKRMRPLIMEQRERNQMLENETRIEASKTIARWWRGYEGRYRVRTLQRIRCAVSIQRMIRGYGSRKKTYRQMEIRNAAIVLQRSMRQYVVDVQTRRLMDWVREREPSVIRIQSGIRKYLACISVDRFRQTKYRNAERLLVARAYASRCQKSVSAYLLLKSASKSLRYDGALQAMFRYWASYEGKTKLEGKALVKLLQESPGVISKRLSVTDVDLIFASKKSQNTKVLTFNQFIQVLKVVMDHLFPDDDDEVKYEGYVGKRAKLLKLIFHHLFQSITNKRFERLHYDASISYMNSMATSIQSLCRKRLSRYIYDIVQLQRNNELQSRKQSTACTKIQQTARRYLARTTTIALAQSIYKKYHEPSTGQPYWYDTRTEMVSWEKPKVFGTNADCVDATFVARRGREYIVTCSKCQRNAMLNCTYCQDSFCKVCYTHIHQKGHRRIDHRKQLLKIPICKVCGYQHATRTCATCTADSLRNCDYCDVCFVKTHDDVPQNDDDDETRNHRRHRTSWLVVPCVECQTYTARYRCVDCRDLFCFECFEKLHSHGNRVRHVIEDLAYYTPAMHERYARWERFRHRRTDSVTFDFRIHREKRVRAAIRIQTTWRAYEGRCAGKAYLKRERRKIRMEYRARKYPNKRGRYIKRVMISCKAFLTNAKQTVEHTVAEARRRDTTLQFL